MNEYKVAVFGYGVPGKTALITRFVTGTFVDIFDPTIEGIFRKQLKIGGETVVMEITDTGDANSFSGLHNLYFKNGDGFIFVYSVTSSSSLEDLPPLAEQMRRVKDK
ncbi:Ras-related protein Rap-1b [Geodia barretti]|uniref:Ras-related protein Rap-1b n=1 Tax=Geodia barretti TaxID=519541 RepID=A0AA35SXA0_GEOBA|nr:Ras-related protein Rap-1b [Geodia barretti]